MALAANDIVLHPLAWRRSFVSHIWEEYSMYSVEAITAGPGGVYDFSQNHCMYFAVIKQLVTVEAESDDIGLDDPYASASEDEVDPWSPHPQSQRAVSKHSGHTTVTKEVPIGVIYLASDQLPGCVNLGCCITPTSRGHGYGSLALRLVLGWAFQELGCHRVQVRIADGDPVRRKKATSMLLSMGFLNEGTSRRSLFCPSFSKEERTVGLGGEWRDVQTYAMLDTDWVIQKDLSSFPPPLVRARWEEMFRQHDRERGDMLAFEEYHERKAYKERATGKQVKRTTSTETIKDGIQKESEIRANIQMEYSQPSAIATTSTSTGGISFSSPRYQLSNSPGPAEPAYDEIDDVLQDILDGARTQDHSYSPGPSNGPPAPHHNPAFQGHRDPFAFVPSAARFRSVSPSVSSVQDQNTEDEFHSSASSPLLPRSPLMGGHDTGSESEWEIGSVPRSSSVLSSRSSSTSSWDNFDWEESDEASVHSFDENR